MKKTTYDDFASTPEGRRLLNREALTIEVTELICKTMQEKGISRKQLAELLGKSKGRVSQMLNGECNLTLRTVADILTALDACLVVRRRPDPHLAHDSVRVKTTKMQDWVEQVRDDEALWRFERGGVRSGQHSGSGVAS